MKILKVDSKDYILHYSINSLVRMEKETGKGFTDLFSEDSISLESLRDVIFYGLVSKQRKITADETGDIIDALIQEGQSIMEISQMFITELTKALGMAQIEEETSPNA